MTTNSSNRKCSQCGSQGFGPGVVRFSDSFKHDNREVSVQIDRLPAMVCGNCGHFTLNTQSFERIDREISLAARLLLPEDLKRRRQELRLKKREMAALLRVSPESIGRWENGKVRQSSASDLLLRLYLGSEAVRQLVSWFHAGADLGAVEFPMKTFPAESLGSTFAAENGGRPPWWVPPCASTLSDTASSPGVGSPSAANSNYALAA